MKSPILFTTLVAVLFTLSAMAASIVALVICACDIVLYER
ncbi:hypothetical protein E24_00374 [Faustovirus]|nr:hypothetical protein E24_00374 [Faustovirus]AMN84275.1 hypothetical protein D5a_00373 [Faustovirus]AMN85261.1 hypothetical protein E23_00374 [Faustovirus]